jgi:sulfate adenylyltransferase
MIKTLIQPHGGKLVDRYLTGSKCEFVGSAARSLPKFSLSARNLADLECIATGVYSPLEGFVTEAEYESIVENLRLPNGLAWSIPVTLQMPAAEADKYPLDTDIALVHPNGEIVVVMSVTSKYQPNQQREAEAVYQTTDFNHPGVQAMLAEGTVYLGGPISMVNSINHHDFLEFRLTPQMTRQIFMELEWQTIAAFQTRKPIHRPPELRLHPLYRRTRPRRSRRLLRHLRCSIDFRPIHISGTPNYTAQI